MIVKINQYIETQMTLSIYSTSFLLSLSLLVSISVRPSTSASLILRIISYSPSSLRKEIYILLNSISLSLLIYSHPFYRLFLQLKYDFSLMFYYSIAITQTFSYLRYNERVTYIVAIMYISLPFI